MLAAYRFLSQFYRPGDNIYVFGFSRGAFTARSLCGFLSASGLLTEDACNAANLEFAWDYYRTPPKARFPADRARLRRITYAPEPRISFLGVFDTVGALGIPKGFMSRLSRRAIQFHDADVSSVVDYCCHALAIDEQRLEFEAAVWTEPRHRKYRAVEQAWFPGSHANVGGGCDDSGLSDLALDWMLKRVARHCPELRLSPPETWPRQLSPSYRGQLYDARSWMFWRSRWRPLIRLINRCELERAWRCRLPEIRPHSRPIGEMVHWSALAPLGGDQGRPAPAALPAAQPAGRPARACRTTRRRWWASTASRPRCWASTRPMARRRRRTAQAPPPRPSANGAGSGGEAAQARSAGEGADARGLPPAPAWAGHPPRPTRFLRRSARAGFQQASRQLLT